MLSKGRTGSSSCWGSCADPAHHGSGGVRGGRTAKARSRVHDEDSSETNNGARGGGSSSRMGNHITDSTRAGSGSYGAAAGRWQRKQSRPPPRVAATDSTSSDQAAAGAYSKRSPLSSSYSRSTGAAVTPLVSHESTSTSSRPAASPQHSRASTISSESSKLPLEASREERALVAGSSGSDMAPGFSASAHHPLPLGGRDALPTPSAPAFSSDASPPGAPGEGVGAGVDEFLFSSAGTAVFSTRPACSPGAVSPDRASARKEDADSEASSSMGNDALASRVQLTHHNHSAPLFSGVGSHTETATPSKAAKTTPWVSSFPAAGHPDGRGSVARGPFTGSSRQASINVVGSRPSVKRVSRRVGNTAAAGHPIGGVSSDSRAPRSSRCRRKASTGRARHVETTTSGRGPLEVSSNRASHPEETRNTLALVRRDSAATHVDVSAASPAADSSVPAEHRTADSPAGASVAFSLPQLGVVGGAIKRDVVSAVRDRMAGRESASGVSPPAAVTPCAGAPGPAATAVVEATAAATAAGATILAAARSLPSLAADGATAPKPPDTPAVVPAAVAATRRGALIPEDRLLQQQQQRSGEKSAEDHLLPQGALPVSDTAARMGGATADRVDPRAPRATEATLPHTATLEILPSNRDSIVGEAGATRTVVVGESEKSSRPSQVHTHASRAPGTAGSVADLAKGETPLQRGGGDLGSKPAAAAGSRHSNDTPAAARPSTAAAGAALPAAEHWMYYSASIRADIAPPAETAAARSWRLPTAPPKAGAVAAGEGEAAKPGASAAGRVAPPAETPLPARNVPRVEPVNDPEASAAAAASAATTPTEEGAAAAECPQGDSSFLSVSERTGEQTCIPHACSNIPAQRRPTSEVLEGGRRTAAAPEASAVAGVAASGDTVHQGGSGGGADNAAAAAAAAAGFAVTLGDGRHGLSSGASDTLRRSSSDMKNSSSPALRSSAYTKKSGSRWVRTTVAQAGGSSASAEKQLRSSLSGSISSAKSSRPGLTNSSTPCTPEGISSTGGRYSSRSMMKKTSPASSSSEGPKLPEVSGGRSRRAAVSRDEGTSEAEREVSVTSGDTKKTPAPLLQQRQQQQQPTVHGAARFAESQERRAPREQAEADSLREAQEVTALQQRRRAQQAADVHTEEVFPSVGHQLPRTVHPQEQPMASASRHIADLQHQEQKCTTASAEQRCGQKEDEPGVREQQQQGRGGAESEQVRDEEQHGREGQTQRPASPLQQERAFSQHVEISPERPQAVEAGQQHVLQRQEAQVAGSPPRAPERQPVVTQDVHGGAALQVMQQEKKGEQRLQEVRDPASPRRHAAVGGTGREGGKVEVTDTIATFPPDVRPASCSCTPLHQYYSSSSWLSSSSSSPQQICASCYSFSSSVVARSFFSAVPSPMCSASYISSAARASAASRSFESHGYSTYSALSAASSSPPVLLSCASSSASDGSFPSTPAGASCVSSAPSFDMPRLRLPQRASCFTQRGQSARPALYLTACARGEATAAGGSAGEATRAAAPVATVGARPPAAPGASAEEPAATASGGSRRGSSSLARAAARNGLRLLDELKDLPGPEGEHARTLAAFLRRHTGSDDVSGRSSLATAAATSAPAPFSLCEASASRGYSAAGFYSETPPHSHAHVDFMVDNSSSSGSSADGFPVASCGSNDPVPGYAHADAAEGRGSSSSGNPTIGSSTYRDAAMSSGSRGSGTGREAGNSSGAGGMYQVAAREASSAAGFNSSQYAVEVGSRADREEASRPVAASSRLNLDGISLTPRRSSAATVTTIASASEGCIPEKQQLKDTPKQPPAAEQQLLLKPREGSSRHPQPSEEQYCSREQQQSRAKQASQRHRGTQPASDPVLPMAAAARVAYRAVGGEAAANADEGRACPAAGGARARGAAERIPSSSLKEAKEGGSSIDDGAVYISKREADTDRRGEQNQLSGEGPAKTGAPSRGFSEDPRQCSSEASRQTFFEASSSAANKYLQPSVGSVLAARSACRSTSEDEAGRLAALSDGRMALEESPRAQQQQQQKRQNSKESAAAEAGKEGNRKPWRMSFDVPRLLAAAAAVVGRNYQSYFGRSNTTICSNQDAGGREATSSASKLAQSAEGTGTRNAGETASLSADAGSSSKAAATGARKPRRFKSMPAELQKRGSCVAATAHAEKGGRQDERNLAAGQEVERQRVVLCAAAAGSPHDKKRGFVDGVASASAQPDAPPAAPRCHGSGALQEQPAAAVRTSAKEDKAARTKEESWKQCRDGEEVHAGRASSRQHEQGRQQHPRTGATCRRRSTCRFCRARAATNYQRRRQSAVERGTGAAAAGHPLLSRALLVTGRSRQWSRSTSSSSVGVPRSRGQHRSSRSGGGSRSSSKSSRLNGTASGRRTRRRKRRGSSSRSRSSSASHDSAVDETRREMAAEGQRSSAPSPGVFAVRVGGRRRDTGRGRGSSFDRLLSPDEEDRTFTFPSITLRKKLWTTATIPAAVCSCSRSVGSDAAVTQQERGKSSQQQAGGDAERHSVFRSEYRKFEVETDTTVRGPAAAAVGDNREAPVPFGSRLFGISESSLQSAAPLATSGQPFRQRRQSRQQREARRTPEQGQQNLQLDDADLRTGVVAPEAEAAAAGGGGGEQTDELSAARLTRSGLNSSRSGEREEAEGRTAEDDTPISWRAPLRHATAPARSSHSRRRDTETEATDRRRGRITQESFFSRGGAYDLSTLWPSHQREELRRGVLGWFQRDVRSSYFSFSSWFGSRSELFAETLSDSSDPVSPRQQQVDQQQRDGESLPAARASRGETEAASHRQPASGETAASASRAVAAGDTAAYEETAGASDGVTREAAAAAPGRASSPEAATATTSRITSLAAMGPLSPESRRPAAAAFHERGEEASFSPEEGAGSLRKLSKASGSAVPAVHLVQQPLVSCPETNVDSLQWGGEEEHDGDGYFTATEDRKGEETAGDESSTRVAGASRGPPRPWPRLAAEETALNQAAATDESGGDSEERPWRRAAEALLAGARSRINAAIKREEDRWSSWSSQVAALSYSPRLRAWETSRETPSPHARRPSRGLQAESGGAASARKQEEELQPERRRRRVSRPQQKMAEERSPASPRGESSDEARQAAAAGTAAGEDAAAAAADVYAGVAPTRAATAPPATSASPVAAATAAGGGAAAVAEGSRDETDATAERSDATAAEQRVHDSSQQQATPSFAEKVGGLLCRVSSCSWVNPPARRPPRLQRVLAKAQKRDLALFIRRRLRRLSNSSAGTELRGQRTSSSSSAASNSSDEEEGGRNSWSRDVAAVASTPPASPAALLRSPKSRDAPVSSTKGQGSISASRTHSASSAGRSASGSRDGSVSTRSSSSSLPVVHGQQKHAGDTSQHSGWTETGESSSFAREGPLSAGGQQLSPSYQELSAEPGSGRDETAAAETRGGGAGRETTTPAGGPRSRAALQRSNTIPFAPDEAYRSGVAGGRGGGCLLPATGELNECLRSFPQCILEALIRGSRSSSWLEQQKQLLRCRRRLQKHRRRLQAREPSLKVAHSSWRSLGDWQLIPNRSKSTSAEGLPAIVVTTEDDVRQEAPPGGRREEEDEQQHQAAAAAQGKEDACQQTENINGRVGQTSSPPAADADWETAAADGAVGVSSRVVLKSIKRNNTQEAEGGLEGTRSAGKGAALLEEGVDADAAQTGKAVATAGAGRAAADAGRGPTTAAAGKTFDATQGNAAAVTAMGGRQSQESPLRPGRATYLPNPWRTRNTGSGRRANGPPEAFRRVYKGSGGAAQMSTSSSPALPPSCASSASGGQAAGDDTGTASRGRLSLWLGAHSIPRDDKRYRGGEDAWFLSSTCNAMGVADGVSEWEDLAGINPQKFAQDLMRGTFKHIRRLKKLKALGLIQGIRAAAAQRLSEKKAAAAAKASDGSPGTGRPPRAAAEGRGRGAAAAAAGKSPAASRDDDKKKKGGANNREEDEEEEMEGDDSLDKAVTGDGCATLDAAEMARVALTWSYHEAKHYGSSTALVGVLDERTGVIGFANLGDSSGMVLRRVRRGGTEGSSGQPTLGVVRRVKEMQHSFNVPYQFGHVPAPEDWSRLRSTGLEKLVSIAEKDFRQRCNQATVADGSAGECAESAIGDLPSAIEKLTVHVQEGDLILIGTDGLFDNVFDYEITALSGLAVSPVEAKKLFLSTSHATPPSEVARALALAAYWRSLDPNAQTPFSKETKKQLTLQGGAGGQDRWRSYLSRFAVGGKEDDITVVAAWVVTEADATPGLIGTGVVPGESLSQEEEEMLLMDEDD